MPGLLGKKIGMTNMYTQDGKQVPVTAIEVGPCTVLDVKTDQRDGYRALKLGYGDKKNKHVKKPEYVFYKKNNLKPRKVVKEFRNFENYDEYKVGDTVSLDVFNVGDKIKVRGNTKGKGFQGVMRRHNFAGVGGTTHGQSDRLRAPGSIGQMSDPSRVFKGRKMAGRTGYSKVTVRNIDVMKVLPEKNIVLVKGAVPGAINSIVELNK